MPYTLKKDFLKPSINIFWRSYIVDIELFHCPYWKHLVFLEEVVCLSIIQIITLENFCQLPVVTSYSMGGGGVDKVHFIIMFQIHL